MRKVLPARSVQRSAAFDAYPAPGDSVLVVHNLMKSRWRRATLGRSGLCWPLVREEANIPRHDSDWPAECQQHLLRLRQADPGYQTFGSRSHRFRPAPTISRRALEAFEAKHDVRLPSDYREHVLHVGNGGVGPSYGLLPVADPDGVFAQTFLARSTDAKWTQPAHLDFDGGTFELCHHGCADYSYLVVRGETAGSVWSGGDGRAMHREADSFAEWYRSWAKEALLKRLWGT